MKASDSTKKQVQTLEMAIRLGQPVLLENVLEALDPFLDPVLANQAYKDRGLPRDQARRERHPVPRRLQVLR